MRIELLSFKFQKLKTKRPKKEYTAYLNENDYIKILEQRNREVVQNLFLNEIIINEIQVCPTNKLKENEILVILQRSAITKRKQTTSNEQKK